MRSTFSSCTYCWVWLAWQLCCFWLRKHHPRVSLYFLLVRRCDWTSWYCKKQTHYHMQWRNCGFGKTEHAVLTQHDIRVTDMRPCFYLTVVSIPRAKDTYILWNICCSSTARWCGFTVLLNEPMGYLCIGHFYCSTHTQSTECCWQNADSYTLGSHWDRKSVV